MHEAPITDVSKAGALKVISRPSTLPYRDSDKSPQQIAKVALVEERLSRQRVSNRVLAALSQILRDLADDHALARIRKLLPQ